MSATTRERPSHTVRPTRPTTGAASGATSDIASDTARDTASVDESRPARREGAGSHRRWPAVAAVVLGVLLVGVAVLRGTPQVEAVGTTSWRPAASASPAPTLVSHPLKVAQGGYVVRVPEGTRSSVKGAVSRIRATDDSLLLTITPTPRTPDPALGNARVLKAMEGAYATVRQTSNQRQSVGGRAAVASYGTVTTKQGATLRYVVISVAGAKRGWAISAFTRGDSDASRVLPLVRAVVNGFRPLS